ncbi:MAG: PAS domain S-box protein [Nitrospiraceae bacterium]|nr:PAS domain S-box protein [Nitrospiraceae bacterium]
MRKTLIYNFFILLLAFALAMIVPLYFLIDRTSAGIIHELGKVAPLSFEQRLVFTKLIQNVKDNLISMSFYTFVIAFMISLFFGRRLLKPLKELYAAATSIKEGNFEIQVDVSGESELKDVSSAFNGMARALKEKTEELVWKDRYVSMMMDPLWVIGNDDRIIDINPAFTKLFGYERDDVIGYLVYELMDEENEKVMRKQLQFREDGMTSTYELQVISKRGELIPVLITGAPIYNEKNELAGKIGIMKDFRKETALRRALNQANDYQRAIMDSMPDMLVVIDRGFNIQMANKAAQEAADGDFAGMQCYQLFYSRQDNCNTAGGKECPVANVFATGKPHKSVHEHIENGRQVSREVIAFPIKDEAGYVNNVVAIARDVTEKKVFEVEIAQKNKELITLLGISKSLNQSLRSEEIFGGVLEKLVEMTGMDGGSIFFLDEMGRELSCKYHKGLSADFMKESGPFRIGEDVPGRAAATGQTFTTSDLSNDPRAEKSVFRHTGIRACAAFPITGKEKTTGVFVIFSFNPHVFSLEEERILNSVGEMAGMALENIRLYERMRMLFQHQRWRKTEEQKQLLQVASVLTTKLDLKEMLNTALMIVKNTIRADFVWFLEPDQRNNLVLKSAPEGGVPEDTVVYDAGDNSIEGYALEKKEPVIISELQIESDFQISSHLAERKFKTACAIPVYSGDKALAVVSFYCSTFKQPKEEDIFFLQTIASILDVAIERARLYEKTILDKGMSETILESIEDGIITVDPEGGVISMNRTAGELAGLAPSSAIGSKCTELFGGSEENARLNILLLKDLERCMKGEQTQHNITITSGKGMKVPVLLNGFPVKNKDGSSMGVVFAFRNNSRQEEVNRLKSDFIRSISHEFRTPLSAIVGMSEMLLEEQMEKEKEEVYLSTILSEGQRLSDMVSDLLDLATIESGKEILRIKDLDMAGMLSEIKEEFQAPLHKKGASLELRINGQLPAFSGDAEKLKRMLRNIIDNSLTYSNPGCRVEITAAGKNSHIELVIKDNGWGIPPDELNHIGEKFYRARNASNIKGTGLGLSLSKEIIRMHNGKIQIDSKNPGGTTVRLQFPSRRAKR